MESGRGVIIGGNVNQSMSNLIENMGIGLFKATNRKKTDLETFQDCNHLEYDKIQSFYKDIQLFESCEHYNPPVSILSKSSRKIKMRIFTMDSMYEPIQIFQKPYDTFPENKKIYFEEMKSLQSDSGEKTCVIYLHGFSENSYAPEKKLIFERLIAQISGMEVLAVQLPYHMKRSPKKQPYSGAYVLDSYPVVTIESFRQAVNDVSQVLSYAKEKYKKVIVAGFSLGGFVTSFLGTCDDRADLYIVGQAGAHIPNTLKNLSICPGLTLKKELWAKQGIDFESLYEHIDLLKYQPVVPPEKVISIAGLYDKLIDMEDVEQLRRFFKSSHNINYSAGHKGILFEIKKLKGEVMGVIAQLGAEGELHLENPVR